MKGEFSFHNGTELALVLEVERNAENCNPFSVINVIDNFCYQRHWMMHVGEKRIYIENEIKRLKPLKESLTCVEIGSYCGYSATVIASKFSHGDKIFCIENNHKCIEWTKRILSKSDLLNNFCELLLGTSADYIDYLKSKIKSIDILFIDHDKKMYLSDLKLFESSGLLISGSTIIADNVLTFGSELKPYLDYVRNSGKYSSNTLHHTRLEYSNDCSEKESSDNISNEIENKFIDGVDVSIFA